MRCTPGGFARDPHARRRVDLGVADRGEERVAGRGAGGELEPRDRRVRVLRQGDAARRSPRSRRTPSPASPAGSTSSSWLIAGIAVSSPASTNAGASAAIV